MNKVTISLGKGMIETGLKAVTVQICDRDGQLIVKQQGHLVPNPQLLELYPRWRSLYRSYYLDFQQSMRIEILEAGDRSLNFSQSEFKHICQQLERELNNWLNHSFADIRWH